MIRRYEIHLVSLDPTAGRETRKTRPCVVVSPDTILELTRHGKKVAVVRSTDAAESAPDLASWIGSGKGTVTFGPNYKADAPAWNTSDSKILKYRQVGSIASRKD